MGEPHGGGSRPPRPPLRGVLFDSGDVLVRPTSPNDAPATEAWRRWFGGPRFVATLREATLFIDDWRPHVQTAIASGFQGAVLDRDAEAPAVPGLTYLTDLHDVERLVAAATPPARQARPRRNPSR